MKAWDSGGVLWRVVITSGNGDRALGGEKAAAPARPTAKAEIARAPAPAPKPRRDTFVIICPWVVSVTASPPTVAPPTITVKNFRTDNAPGKTPSKQGISGGRRSVSGAAYRRTGLVFSLFFGSAKTRQRTPIHSSPTLLRMEERAQLERCAGVTGTVAIPPTVVPNRVSPARPKANSINYR